MSDMSEIIKSSLDGIKSFANVDATIGNVISTPSGVTIIPISKITVGFAGGGFDYGQKKLSQSQNFGSGSGTGISISPVAFLTVNNNSDINLISVSQDESKDRLLSIIEHSPELIEKIRASLS